MEVRTELMEKRLLKLLEDTSMKNAVPFQWSQCSMKVLILAPHYDDDVISCGGAMYLHCQRRDTVDVIYFTDGSASKESGLDKNELSTVRQLEAQKACAVIGNGIHMTHLKEKDGEFQETNQLIEWLADKIHIEDYDRIYFPSIYDIHKDHFTVSKILNTSLSMINYTHELMIYEFWNPLKHPNRFVQVDGIEDIKLNALAEHKSQIKYVDYVRLVKTLNRNRGGMADCKSCEAFQLISKYEFKRIIENSLNMDTRRR